VTRPDSLLFEGFARGLLVIAALSMACTPDDEASKSTNEDTGSHHLPAVELPDAAEVGAYAAATRDDQITTPSGQPLRVQTWYPADASSTEALHTYNDLIEGTALDGAVPACDGTRPVVMFSHGNGGMRFQSMFVTEHLATRGWVVVAPDHEGNTAFDLNSDRAGEHAIRRPRDISETFDWLVDELAAAGGPLEGCVDPAAGFAIVGHSFGGYTSVALTSATITSEHASTCAPGWLCDDTAAWLEGNPASDPTDLRDDRIWASVPMTPAAYELLAPTLGENSVPTLILGGSFDPITPMESQVQPIFNDLGGTKHLAEIDTAGHFTFSDVCTLLPTYEDCNAPFMSLEEAHPLIRGMTTAFLEKNAGLDDQSDTWLPPAHDRVRWEDG